MVVFAPLFFNVVLQPNAFFLAIFDDVLGVFSHFFHERFAADVQHSGVGVVVGHAEVDFADAVVDLDLRAAEEPFGQRASVGWRHLVFDSVRQQAASAGMGLFGPLVYVLRPRCRR